MPLLGCANEQRLRGTADGAVDSALVITGHDANAVADAAQELATSALEHQGASGVTRSPCRLDHSLVCTEVAAQAVRQARHLRRRWLR